MYITRDGILIVELSVYQQVQLLFKTKFLLSKRYEDAG